MQFCRESENMHVALITALVGNIFLMLTPIFLVTIESSETYKTKCNSTIRAIVAHKINIVQPCWNIIEPIIVMTSTEINWFYTRSTAVPRQQLLFLE